METARLVAALRSQLLELQQLELRAQTLRCQIARNLGLDPHEVNAGQLLKELEGDDADEHNAQPRLSPTQELVIGAAQTLAARGSLVTFASLRREISANGAPLATSSLGTVLHQLILKRLLAKNDQRHPPAYTLLERKGAHS